MAQTSFAQLTLIGFDSAWADNERRPGAICALEFDQAGQTFFRSPTLVGFDEAAEMIEKLHTTKRKTLVAIDQPTIVPNETGMRPCEKVIASVISWSGGGIQPANRGKTAMFGDDAPIWRFLDRLDFIDDPEACTKASAGGFVLEVFPALALLGFDPSFAALRAGPRYNPARGKTFRQDAWRVVCNAVIKTAETLGFRAVADWCRRLDEGTKPSKSMQDSLDSIICLLVAALWIANREQCVMVGDLVSGYIVAPVGPDIRARLTARAARNQSSIA